MLSSPSSSTWGSLRSSGLLWIKTNGLFANMLSSLVNSSVSLVISSVNLLSLLRSGESKSWNAWFQQDRKPLDREGRRVNWYELVGIFEGPRETGDQAMEERENLHAWKLVARTHPRAPTERDECERSRAGSFEPWRIELLRLPEILRVPIRGVHGPVNLLCAGKNFTTQTQWHDGSDQKRLG